MRVLVVEDHPRLAETVATVLRREGMAVDLAFDGREALGRVALADYDVVVLDRDLPGVHGDEVCRAMVADGRPSRVLMLTAAGTLEDRVAGLGIGADDYLPKPFHLAELVARVRALSRRSRPALAPTLVHGDLELDSARRRVTRAGRPVALEPEGVRRARTSPWSRGSRRFERADARAGLGRRGRPVHEYGPYDGRAGCAPSSAIRR